jgi:hypothetical protein
VAGCSCCGSTEQSSCMTFLRGGEGEDFLDLGGETKAAL